MTYAVCQKHQGVLCWFYSMETSMLLCISLHTMFSAHWLSTRVSTEAFLWIQLINSNCVLLLFTSNFVLQKVMNEWARGSECYDKVVCPNCMHTTCNSTYFVMAAALYTERKKKTFGTKQKCVQPSSQLSESLYYMQISSCLTTYNDNVNMLMSKRYNLWHVHQHASRC